MSLTNIPNISSGKSLVPALTTISKQHKHEIRSTDFGQQSSIQTTECSDIQAMCTNSGACHCCGPLDHFIKDCPQNQAMNKYPQHKPSNPASHPPNKPTYSDHDLFQAFKIFFLSGGPPMPSHSIHKFHNSTQPNKTYHLPKHKQNKHDKFPKDRNKIQAKHVRTKAIEETELHDPESSEEGKGDNQVSHIEEPPKKSNPLSNE